MSAGIKASFFISPLQLKCNKAVWLLAADDPRCSCSGPEPKESTGTKAGVPSLADSVLKLFANFFIRGASEAPGT